MSGRLPVRTIVWTLALGLLALPLVGLFMGWFASSHWPVRSLRVDGTFQHVSAQQVRSRAAHLLTPGFFAVDPGQIQQAVAALPWVERVEVRKHWPDQLRIRFTEHQPFAHWNGDAMINRHGDVFQVPDAGRLASLPDLRGPAGTAEQVLRFYLDARKHLASVDLHVTGLSLNPRGSWQVQLAGGAVVMIGKEQPERRLARFIAGYQQLGASPQRPLVSADLRYSNGFAVRWPQPEDPTGGPPPA